MGVVPPAPGFLEALRALCDASGALLVFDEVITGFRVARGGAQERYGVYPDLTILGKIVGGGLPAAAFGGRADVMERLAPAGDVYQAGTLSGNPLATAAGISVLRRLRDPQRLRAARGEGRPARGGPGAVRPRAARRRDGDALPRRPRRSATSRTRRRATPSGTARSSATCSSAASTSRRRSSSACSSRSPTPTPTSTGRSRPLPTSSTTDLWDDARRRGGGREPALGRGSCAPSRNGSGSSGRWRRSGSRSGSRRSTRATSSITGAPVSFEPADDETALLLGDYLYAHGLVRIAATGELDAVVVLAELISTCAHLRAEQAAGDGEAWVDAVRKLGGDPELGAVEQALAAHASRLVSSRP